jgi:hypothetical protein
MLTKNFQKLKDEVAHHVSADLVAQGSYKTCFIGCLADGRNDTEFIENEYGIPLMVTRIAESVFEGLLADEAIKFFADFAKAGACDGKDLTRVGWQFLAAELRALPPVPNDTQAVIDPVIKGMDLLAEGKEWPEAAVDAAATDATAAAAEAAYWHAASAVNAASAAHAATWSADAARDAAAAFARDAAAFAHASASAADYDYAARAAWSADAADAAAKSAARLRQRDTLLQLISEAPITQEENN